MTAELLHSVTKPEPEPNLCFGTSQAETVFFVTLLSWQLFVFGSVAQETPLSGYFGVWADLFLDLYIRSFPYWVLMLEPTTFGPLELKPPYCFLWNQCKGAFFGPLLELKPPYCGLWNQRCVIFGFLELRPPTLRPLDPKLCFFGPLEPPSLGPWGWNETVKSTLQDQDHIYIYIYMYEQNNIKYKIPPQGIWGYTF